MKAHGAPGLWSPQKRKPTNNGWGFVVRMQHKTVYAHGVLPDGFLRRFVTRRAFIYMMEILAAVMAVYVRHELPKYFILFVDNQAGNRPFKKGTEATRW